MAANTGSPSTNLDDLLQSHPELRPHLLTNVRLTGNRIGAGAYGTVEEVAIPEAGAFGAAKKIHDYLQDPGLVPARSFGNVGAQFVQECELLSTIEHHNIVKFFGIYFFPGSRLPALVMERLHTSLHDLLNPPFKPKLPLPLKLKCSILCDVASALLHLHLELSPPVYHCDLSARNVVLSKEMVAKIVDLGLVRRPLMRAASSFSVGAGALVYMPPEVLSNIVSGTQPSNASVDIFSLGVLTIFVISEVFPCNLLPPTYPDPQTNLLVARTELERRQQYMDKLNEQLKACDQFHGDHPLIKLIQQCLHNEPSQRPDIRAALNLLERARDVCWDQQTESDLRDQLAKDLWLQSPTEEVDETPTQQV